VQAQTASQVLQGDLRWIAVFDCYYNTNIRAVQGRIINRLPRPIHDVTLKLSVNGYEGTVVDVEHVIASDTLIPEEPQSFSYSIEIPGLYTRPGEAYLPDVWLYHVLAEVTDAYYAD
jgi:hypothetical protein